jgi:glycylpeptide N-tetradecanoyltransferase
MEEHKFWKTQPLQDTKKNAEVADIIEFDDTMFSDKPLDLPDNFSWADINPDSDQDIDDLYNFLYLNYNNPDSSFGIHYSKELLRYYMLNPINFKNTFIVVRYNYKKIVGSIIGCPISMNIFGRIDVVCDTSFLCVNKSIRQKNLGSILIKEVCRRMYFNKIRCGYGTTFLKLPSALAKTTCFHRIINIDKLLEIKFFSKPQKISMKSFKKLFEINDQKSRSIRKLQENDIEYCAEFYNNFYKKYKIYQCLSVEEFRYKFLTDDNVVESFVSENNGIITSFISVFYVNAHVFNNKKYKDYSIAQIYYYFYRDEDVFIDLLSDLLCLMKEKHIDVVNCMDNMDSYLFLDKLNFKQGSGELNFYLWNKKCPAITNRDIALITI